MKLVFLLLFLFSIIFLVQSKNYTRCGLTSELVRLGFQRSYIGHWVCMIESESAKDTSKVSNRANGGKGLGLFQINSKKWCTFGKAGGNCNIKCEDLINEDLRDDSACAKKIHNENGFKEWDGWMHNCYKRTLPFPNC